MDLDIIIGVIQRNILVIGDKILWSNLVFTSGLMEEIILVNTKMIKSKVMVHICGLMEEFTEDIGKMGNNMV